MTPDTLAALESLAPDGPRQVGANQPFLADDPLTLWVVATGKIDLFVVPVKDGRSAGARSHFLRLTAGDPLLGVQPAEGWGWLAVGDTDASVLSLPLDLVKQQSAVAAEVAGSWLTALDRAFECALPPRVGVTAVPGEPVSVPKGGVVSASREPVWLRLGQAVATSMGRPEAPARGVFPVTRRLWVKIESSVQVDALDTARACAEPAAWSALAALNQYCLLAGRDRALGVADELNHRLEAGPERNVQAVMDGLFNLAAVLPGRGLRLTPPVQASDALVAACKLVGKALGHEIRPPTGFDIEGQDPIERLALASRCRVRGVKLTADWWRKDNGPLLAFMKEDGRPVALIPPRPGRYHLEDPQTHQIQRVDEALAGKLLPDATMFYQPLPAGPVTPWSLLKFGLRTTGGDLYAVFWMALATGILSLVTPIATGLLVGEIIPAGERPELVSLGIALLVATLGSGAFQLTRSIALLHMEGKMDGAVQAAVMDRLLNLPAPFFRKFSTGDLTNRALGIDAVRSSISGATISSLIGALTSVFSLGLLFYYDWKLAIVGTLLILVMSTVLFGVSLWQLRYQRPLLDLEGELSGSVYQWISGIAKLRVAGAEARTFRQWAGVFSRQRALAFRVGRISNNLGSFQSGFKILTQMFIFGFIAWRGYDALDTASFLAFNTAFGQLTGALISVTSALTSMLNIGPIMDRARPLLSEPMETEEDKPDPGTLAGHLELSHVSFRYSTEGAWVLHEVSMEARPGEFIAIVGPSGAGKSTLLRLLLGFEAPGQGAVLYDGQDLRSVSAHGIRRQIGVVLQQSNLLPGDIFYNIVGNSGFTVDDAWEAARLAGIKEDIEALPMGMHTVISEGASTFSGGQKQRLMIARAVVSKPRVLFFDEATSALDAQTQEQVSEGLEHLKATRVVIAHRLSTIRRADRIFVLENHTVAQSGTYEELVAQPGPFQELARRQLV